LPEKSDRLLLCQAIELGEHKEESIGVLSNDSDFTEFTNEIFGKFDIEIEDCFY